MPSKPANTRSIRLEKNIRRRKSHHRINPQMNQIGEKKSTKLGREEEICSFVGEGNEGRVCTERRQADK
ncbi:hypothetical protein L484_025558 [Morus notabilis]|uniref:Uncharacterized protein n=1 Tax=Morus notabilis TaxID=981085 RepID=W9RP77_9ROSA|nr:hypothetical protein L484_025558 [Morus notabilis]